MSTIGHASLFLLFDDKNLLNNALKNICDPINDSLVLSDDPDLKLSPRKSAWSTLLFASYFSLFASIKDSSFSIENFKNSPLDTDKLKKLEKN